MLDKIQPLCDVMGVPDGCVSVIEIMKMWTGYDLVWDIGLISI